ncbi:structural maintenance of chromosomes (SMC)family protein [Striga asiatica]|uniref:Structural maintenance of chromosomes (SMC)family protein n=1 Tax=Striga asiatica TaxID=4170 RepID=A0A5A7P9P3_STRAF|nr:structural maintenance of chromosomes (SMC)family protein [Striga asiatica]
MMIGMRPIQRDIAILLDGLKSNRDDGNHKRGPHGVPERQRQRRINQYDQRAIMKPEIDEIPQQIERGHNALDQGEPQRVPAGQITDSQSHEDEGHVGQLLAATAQLPRVAAVITEHSFISYRAHEINSKGKSLCLGHIWSFTKPTVKVDTDAKYQRTSFPIPRCAYLCSSSIEKIALRNLMTNITKNCL